MIHADGNAGTDAAKDFRFRVWSDTTALEPRSLVVDLSSSSTLDSAMIGAIVAAHRFMTGRGGTLRIVGVAPRAVEVLERVGLWPHVVMSPLR